MASTIETRLKQPSVGFYKTLGPEARIIARLNAKGRIEEKNNLILNKALNEYKERLDKATSVVKKGGTITKEELNLVIQEFDNLISYIDRQQVIIEAIDNNSPMLKQLANQLEEVTDKKNQFMTEVEDSYQEIPSISRDLKAYLRRKARTKIFDIQMGTISPFQNIIQSDSLLGVTARAFLKGQTGKSKLSRGFIKLFGIGRDIGFKNLNKTFGSNLNSIKPEGFASAFKTGVNRLPSNIIDSASMKEQQMQNEDYVDQITDAIKEPNTEIISRLDEVLEILHGKKKTKFTDSMGQGGGNDGGLLGDLVDLLPWGKGKKALGKVGRVIGRGTKSIFGRLFGRGVIKAAGVAGGVGVGGAALGMGGGLEGLSVGTNAGANITNAAIASKGELKAAEEATEKIASLKASGKFPAFLKFLGKIPGGTVLADTLSVGGKILGKIAIPLTIALALYDGVMGWKNAEDIAGLAAGEEASTWQKIKAGAASVISGATLNLISSKSIYKGLSYMTDPIASGLTGGNALSLDERIAKKEAELHTLKTSGYDESAKISKAEKELAKLKGLKSVQTSGTGGVVAEFESGSRGPGAISSGVGDAGGKSYGTYQLASKTGTLSDFIKSKEAEPFREQLTSATLASPEFDAIWTKLATENTQQFQQAQHDFISRTHYMPALMHAAELGFDTNNKAIQEMIWSGSVQHGKIKKILDNTAKLIDLSNSTPSEQIRAFYEARSQYTDSLGNVAFAAGRGRYQREAQKVLAYNESQTPATAVASREGGLGATAAAAQVTPVGTPTPVSAPTTVARAPIPSTTPIVAEKQQQTKQQSPTVVAMNTNARETGPRLRTETSIHSPTTEAIRMGAGIPNPA